MEAWKAEMGEVSTSLLELRGLACYFGGLAAVNELNFSLKKGLRQGLIGPNGAGKTTVFNLITGFISASSGSILFKGTDITNLKPHEIARAGISRTYQTNRLFMHLSLLENVLVASNMYNSVSFWSELVANSRAQRDWQAQRQSARDLLDWVGLAGKEVMAAETLSYRDQKLTGIALALAAKPSLLLLDEPSSGLNERETEEMAEVIERINTERGVTVIIIEHKMKFVMGLCSQVAVMDTGYLLTQGSPDEIASNPDVVRIYLGEAA